MIHIAHLRDQIEIQRLVPEWQALWQRVAAATPFQSPEWLLSWWECFGKSDPVIVIARKGHELIAVLPLYVLEAAGCRKLLPIGISLSDYIDALVDPAQPSPSPPSRGEREGPGRASARAGEVGVVGNPTRPSAPLTLPSPPGRRGERIRTGNCRHKVCCIRVANQLLASLVDIPDWEEVYIPDLKPSSALLAADCPIGLSEEKADGEPCPVLSLPSSLEGLREVVPKKTLRDLRQARRRAGEVGEVSVACAAAATLDEFMHEFFRLHEIRWQRLAGHGVCSDATVREFHRRAAKRMLESGMLRLYLLRLGHTPLAAYYGFTAKGAAYGYLSGFDPDYAEVSLGTQIVGHAIEEAVREGAREFHFLRGGESYKYAWGAVDRRNMSRSLRRRC
jgi:CelD/BcsL family acetyltransferase involved in cellulose biosynthesis